MQSLKSEEKSLKALTVRRCTEDTDAVIEVSGEVIEITDKLEEAVTEDTEVTVNAVIEVSGEVTEITDKLEEAATEDTEVTVDTVIEVSGEVTEITDKLEEAVTEVTVDAVIEVTRDAVMDITSQSDVMELFQDFSKKLDKTVSPGDIPEVVFNNNESAVRKLFQDFSEKLDKTVNPGDIPEIVFNNNEDCSKKLDKTVNPGDIPEIVFNSNEDFSEKLDKTVNPGDIPEIVFNNNEDFSKKLDKTVGDIPETVFNNNEDFSKKLDRTVNPGDIPEIVFNNNEVTVNQSTVNITSQSDVRKLLQDSSKDMNGTVDFKPRSSLVKVTDLVRTIKVVVKRPEKDPPLPANLCEATTGDDLQVETTSMGDDKDKVTDVVDVNNNDRDCAGPHLTPETLLKRSGRDETDGGPLHGQRL